MRKQEKPTIYMTYSRTLFQSGENRKLNKKRKTQLSMKLPKGNKYKSNILITYFYFNDRTLKILAIVN